MWLFDNQMDLLKQLTDKSWTPFTSKSKKSKENYVDKLYDVLWP